MRPGKHLSWPHELQPLLVSHLHHHPLQGLALPLSPHHSAQGPISSRHTLLVTACPHELLSIASSCCSRGCPISSQWRPHTEASQSPLPGPSQSLSSWQVHFLSCLIPRDASDCRSMPLPSGSILLNPTRHRQTCCPNIWGGGEKDALYKSLRGNPTHTHIFYNIILDHKHIQIELWT